MPDRRFSVAIDASLCQKMDTTLAKTGVSRQAYIRGLIERDLSDAAVGKGGKDRGKKVVEHDETQQALDKLLDQALLRKLREDPDDFIAGLDDRSFAQLVAARAPKPKQSDEALEESYLSLSRALEKMPDAADLSKELGKAKNRIKKLDVELELQSAAAKSLRGWLKKNCGEDVWREIFERVKALEAAIYDYVKDCEARGLEPEKLAVLCLYSRKEGGEDE